MNIAPAAYIVCVDDGSSCLKYYITAASYTILQQHHIVLNRRQLIHQNKSAGILNSNLVITIKGIVMLQPTYATQAETNRYAHCNIAE